MDEREFLNKIRKMQETGQKVGLTEMKDIDNIETSGKQNIVESFYASPELIFEEDEEMNAEMYKDEGQDITPGEQREEENKFKDMVSQLCKFNKIKVYSENVEWSGKLVREKLNWVYSLEDPIGCYISTDSEDMLQMTDDTLEMLKKMRGYYDVWAEEWSTRLTGGTPPETEGFSKPEFGEPTEGGEENVPGF